jgi:hypothetical protein
VFARGKLDVREGLGELLVAVKVVRVEDLFPPVDLDPGVLDRLDEFERVRLGSAGALGQSKRRGLGGRERR